MNAREKISKEIEKLRDMQAESGSKDQYGRGMYNGIECVRACISGTEPVYQEAPIKDDGLGEDRIFTKDAIKVQK